MPLLMKAVSPYFHLLGIFGNNRYNKSKKNKIQKISKIVQTLLNYNYKNINHTINFFFGINSLLCVLSVGIRASLFRRRTGLVGIQKCQTLSKKKIFFFDQTLIQHKYIYIYNILKLFCLHSQDSFVFFLMSYDRRNLHAAFSFYA